MDVISNHIHDLKNICELLPQIGHSKIRQLDNPAEELIHAHRVSFTMNEYDTIIGILDGGIELPFLIKYVQDNNPNISYLKHSGYSEGHHSKVLEIDEKSSILELFELKEKLENKKILIIDDSIATGRTFKNIVNTISPWADKKNIHVTAVQYIEPKIFTYNLFNYGKDIDASIIPPTFLRDIPKSIKVKNVKF